MVLSRSIGNLSPKRFLKCWEQCTTSKFAINVMFHIVLSANIWPRSICCFTCAIEACARLAASLSALRTNVVFSSSSPSCQVQARQGLFTSEVWHCLHVTVGWVGGWLLEWTNQYLHKVEGIQKLLNYQESTIDNVSCYRKERNVLAELADERMLNLWWEYVVTRESLLACHSITIHKTLSSGLNKVPLGQHIHHQCVSPLLLLPHKALDQVVTPAFHEHLQSQPKCQRQHQRTCSLIEALEASLLPFVSFSFWSFHLHTLAPASSSQKYQSRAAYIFRDSLHLTEQVSKVRSGWFKYIQVMCTSY